MYLFRLKAKVITTRQRLVCQLVRSMDIGIGRFFEIRLKIHQYTIRREKETLRQY